MRTISENPKCRVKDFNVLEIICPEPNKAKIGPNSLSAAFRLQRKKLLEEAETATSTYEGDTDEE